MVKIFCVPFYDIHHFEYDESSTLGSLKNWIEDEVGILTIELLIFNENGCVDEDDNCLISRIIDNVTKN